MPGVGHGVLEWMGQVGERVDSPLTLLREYTTALRALLEGEEVSVAGRYVHLDKVRLAWPPTDLPLLVGAVGPKTMALAGELGDGVIFTGGADGLRESVRIVEHARRAAGGAGPPEAVAFLSVPVDSGAQQIVGHVLALQDQGMTRVTVCGMSSQGPPDGTEAILGLIATLGQARELLNAGGHPTTPAPGSPAG